jgi:hypothetical protein
MTTIIDREPYWYQTSLIKKIHQLTKFGGYSGLSLSMPPRSGLTTMLQLLCSSDENVYVNKTDRILSRSNKPVPIKIMAFDITCGPYTSSRTITRDLEFIDSMVHKYKPKFVVVAGYRIGGDDLIDRWAGNNPNFSSTARINLPLDFCPISDASMGVDERKIRSERLFNLLPTTVIDTTSYGSYSWVMNGRQEPKITSFGSAFYRQ